MPPPITTASRTRLAAEGVGGQVAESSVKRSRLSTLRIWRAGRSQSREELLQRRLTRARVALGALGMLVAVCAIGVGATIWYWLSYLRGPSDTPFTRGPYLLRVSGSEAELRWSARGGKPVTLTAVDPDGEPVDVAERRPARPASPTTRYTWIASVEGTAQAGGSFTTPPAALDRSVRFAVLADYGSGNDDEWAVGRLLAAQRPEFAVTAGDNSYLVAAEALLDRNIFRPLGELMRNAPLYVCLGDHDKFWPGPGAISRAFDLPEGGRFTVHHGPIQVVVLGDEPNDAEAIAFARRELAEPGPAVRFVACHRPLQIGDPILPVLRESGATRLLRAPAPLRAPHRRGRADVHGRHGRPGPRLARAHEGDARARTSACSTSARSWSTCGTDGVGYTYLDKHGSVLDHVVI